MCTVNHRIGTFHDSRTESVILQAVFCWWDSSSRHELLDGFPLPRGYPPASSPGARRMNADPWSAFRLSPLREPDARTRADRFSVRATSRTCSLVVLSKIAARTGSAKWARRRSRPIRPGAGRCPRLRCFKPPPTNASVGARVSATSPGCESGTKKGPMSLVTPGLLERLQKVTCVTSARYARAPYSPVHRRNTQCMSVVRWYSTFVITSLLSYACAARRAASLG